GSDLLHHAGNLVTKDLWLAIERDRIPESVGVVVGVAAEDVEVGPADADARRADADLMGQKVGNRNGAELEPARRDQSGCLHGSAHGRNIGRRTTPAQERSPARYS